MRQWGNGRNASGTLLQAVGCLITLLMVFACGCSGSAGDRQAITTVATKRQQALNTKDIALYATLLSRDYRDKGENFATKKEKLATTFAAFDRLDYRMSDMRVEIKGGEATVSGNFVLRVTHKGKNLNLEGKENLRLKKENGGWKIIGGL